MLSLSSSFYGQLLVDLSSFDWNKYDGMEQMCRLRPKAPLQPYIVPYKGDIDVELVFIPPMFSPENENQQIREGSIKIRVISAQNLIPANHNIRNEKTAKALLNFDFKSRF